MAHIVVVRGSSSSNAARRAAVRGFASAFPCDVSHIPIQATVAGFKEFLCAACQVQPHKGGCLNNTESTLHVKMYLHDI